MARPGITYKDVVKACEQIMAEGDRPTINGVKNILGTGSPNNISTQLKKWRAAHQPKKESDRVLPVAVIASITNEIERCVNVEKLSLEEALSELEKENAQITQHCDKLDEALLVEEENAAKSQARLQASDAAGKEKDKLIESLQQQIEREKSKTDEQRTNAETCRIDLAKATMRLDVLEIQTMGLPEIQKARTDAEKFAEIAQAKETAAKDSGLRMETEIAKLSEKIENQEMEIRTLQAKLTESLADLGHLRVENATLLERLVSREKRVIELEKEISVQE